MNPVNLNLPVVLAIGGHDPSGGAGIQADIETIAVNGCHATSAVTCLTIQDTCNVESIVTVTPSQVLAQAESVLADQQVSAIKIGLIGSKDMVKAISGLLEKEPSIPVVLDPVLAAGGGAKLADDKLITLLRDKLLPLCNLITPNSIEARRLSRTEGSHAHCAETLLELGVPAVLITGGHDGRDTVINRFYDINGANTSFSWERLPGEYHGSGCTLASAIAAALARRLPMLDAVEQAQEYTWLALSHGFRTGRCQSIPNRLFTLERDESGL
jgi:hydroxymethylpyrimidine/phosphomethylpyrimidine kinase